MFKNITIKNLRGITELKIGDFRRVNLLVGKNNCGKTTVLESLFLATAPTKTELLFRINNFRGLGIVDEQLWHLLFNKFGENPEIEIYGELQRPKEKRILKIEQIKDIDIPISASTESPETLAVLRGSYSNTPSRVAGLRMEATFQPQKKGAKPEKIVVEARQAGHGIIGNIPQKQEYPFQTAFINSRTLFGDIGARFNNLQIKKETHLLVNVLQQIEPSLTNLSLGNQGVIYCDIGLNRLLPIYCLGDGISRVLAIILVIWDMKGGVALIDEIENGLYHSSQKILWNTVFKFSKEFDVQVFATTHSMDCVKAFVLSYPDVFTEKEDEVRLYRIERDGDEFKAVDYDYPTLKSSLESDWEIR